MLSSAYDKTDKGREEIATRKHQLTNRLRSLLVMVDGKQSAAELLKKLAAIGLDETSLQELLDLELITPVASLATTIENKPALMIATEQARLDLAVIERKDENPAERFSEDIERIESEQFQMLYNFFNETIKSMLGLRGFTLQLKVERAKSIDDFKILRNPYLEAVLKSKGREIARSLRDRLDMLLYESDKARNDSLTRLTALDFE